jgi:hypothetical protein
MIFLEILFHKLPALFVFQDPLQHLEEYQLTIVLARSRYLYDTEINVIVIVIDIVVRLFLNDQYCHISCQPALPAVNDHQHQH